MAIVMCDRCDGSGCDTCDGMGYWLEWPKPKRGAPMACVEDEAVTQAIEWLQAIAPDGSPAERRAHKQLFDWLQSLRTGTEPKDA